MKIPKQHVDCGPNTKYDANRWSLMGLFGRRFRRDDDRSPLLPPPAIILLIYNRGKAPTITEQMGIVIRRTTLGFLNLSLKSTRWVCPWSVVVFYAKARYGHCWCCAIDDRHFALTEHDHFQLNSIYPHLPERFMGSRK